MQRPALLLAAGLTLASCGEVISAGGGVNGGVIPVASAGTYTYVLTVTDPVVPTNAPGPPGFVTSTPAPGTCALGQVQFYLVSDSGTRDALGANSGSIYLTAGNWHAASFSPAEQPYACPWSLVLTPK
jgi:hypothetical protein